ncbi:MAG: tyrosine-protein phosphatase [Parachlamydiales bacterium]
MALEGVRTKLEEYPGIRMGLQAAFGALVVSSLFTRFAYKQSPLADLRWTSTGALGLLSATLLSPGAEKQKAPEGEEAKSEVQSLEQELESARGQIRDCDEELEQEQEKLKEKGRQLEQALNELEQERERTMELEERLQNENQEYNFSNIEAQNQIWRLQQEVNFQTERFKGLAKAVVQVIFEGKTDYAEAIPPIDRYKNILSYPFNRVSVRSSVQLEAELNASEIPWQALSYPHQVIENAKEWVDEEGNVKSECYGQAQASKGWELGEKKGPVSSWIATQGPLTQTTGQFWAMIWDRKAPLIVCLVNQTELGSKCAPYFPTDSQKTGEFTLEVEELQDQVGYQLRKIKMTRMVGTITEERHVHHLWFLDWPDHGVPNPETASSLIQKITELTTEGEPSVVHCSAGVGRTGTVLGLLMKALNPQVSGDVAKRALRVYRAGMIQTEEQEQLINNYLKAEKEEEV